MIALTDSSRVLDLVNGVRNGASAFTTNLFAGADQLQRWADSGVLSCIPAERSLLILQRDRDFHHLFHSAADRDALAEALNGLVRNREYATLTADLVARPAEIEPVAAVYRDCGFSNYRALVRMMRIGGPDVEIGPSSKAVLAEEADGLAILAFLERLADRFAEQIPTLDDILGGIRRREMLIVRCNGDVGGILFFETTGLSSILRFWFVNDRFRDQGIGGQLMRAFLHLCRASRRIILWVISDNSDAIAKYQHFGFKNDDLMDQIMIRRGI